MNMSTLKISHTSTPQSKNQIFSTILLHVFKNKTKHAIILHVKKYLQDHTYLARFVDKLCGMRLKLPRFCKLIQKLSKSSNKKRPKISRTCKSPGRIMHYIKDYIIKILDEEYANLLQFVSQISIWASFKDDLFLELSPMQ